MFIPQLTAFWHGLTETARSVFISIINSMPPSNQTIIIATDDNNQLIDGQLKTLFGRPWKDTFKIDLPIVDFFGFHQFFFFCNNKLKLLVFMLSPMTLSFAFFTLS